MSSDLGSRAAPGLGRTLLRRALVQNPLFLLSAALVLLAAWLLNPRAPDGTRNLPLLWRLFGAIQLYELALLGAAAVFHRRGGLARDVRGLALVLAPFLVDVTLTTCALLDALLHYDGAEPYLLAAGVVVAATVKIAIAAHLAGVRLTARAAAALCAGPVLVTGFPVLAYLVGESERALGRGPDLSIALAGGLGLAGLVLIFEWAARGDEAGEIVRKLAAVVLPVATIHVGATSWSHASDLGHVAGPLVIALGPALPRLAWPTHAARDRVTPLVLPAIGALVLGASRTGELGLSAWHWGVAGAACVQLRELVRTRDLRSLVSALLALEVAHLAPVLDGASLIAPGLLEPALFAGLFALGVVRGARAGWNVLALALAGLFTLEAHVAGGSLDAVLALEVIGAGVLAWTHRVHGNATAGAVARVAGVFALVLPVYAVWLAGEREGERVLACLLPTIAALLALRVATGLRLYALPALLLPAFAARALPRATTTTWGVAGFALAFLAVALGVVTTLARERLLAWLEGAPAAADAPDA